MGMGGSDGIPVGSDGIPGGSDGIPGGSDGGRAGARVVGVSDDGAATDFSFDGLATTNTR
jgi:hypothetical protein